MQTGLSTKQLLEGFRYELEVTTRPPTVEYYCGEIRRFLRWADSAGIPSDINLITKYHIQSFFHHLAVTHDGNGSVKGPEHFKRVRWPYYRALRAFLPGRWKKDSWRVTPNICDVSVMRKLGEATGGQRKHIPQ